MWNVARGMRSDEAEIFESTNVESRAPSIGEWEANVCTNVRMWNVEIRVREVECTNVECGKVECGMYECTNVRLYECLNVDHDEESRVGD